MTEYDIVKQDDRPQRLGWAPGGYLCKCSICSQQFTGDKRASMCADCAYLQPDPAPTPTGGQVELKPCDKCGSETYIIANEGWYCKNTKCEYAKDAPELLAENAALREEVERLRREPERYWKACLLEAEPMVSDTYAFAIWDRCNSLTAELARLREENEKLQTKADEESIDRICYEVGLNKRIVELRAELSTLRATNAELVEALNLESDSVIGSCNCLTKTNEVQHHKPGCKYRLIVERNTMHTALKDLLFASENADETGYVTDAGFLDLEAIQERARAALDAAKGGEGK